MYCGDKVLEHSSDAKVRVSHIRMEKVSSDMYDWLHSLCVEGKIKPNYFDMDIIVINDGTTALAVIKE